MARVVLAKVGDRDGLPIYSPMSAEDERIVNNQNVLVVDMKSGKAKRTGVQNSAIHLYLEWLAKALNDAGWDMTATMNKLSKKATIPWSLLSIKERLWRPVQLNTFGHESTTKLDTDQVGTVYESLNLVTSERLGVSVNFPDKFMKMYEEDIKAKKV